MAMLEYNEILPKRVILLDSEPYEVIDAQVSRKQQRKPVNQTKLRHLVTRKVTERAFHASEKAQEADLSLREVKYLYENRGQFWFCAPNDPKDRFELPSDIAGPGIRFLKANAVVESLVFNDRIISLRIPIKVELRVKEAPPAVKGDTRQGGSKQVVLETGASVNVPLFINEGDLVRVNTESGEYVERVNS